MTVNIYLLKMRSGEQVIGDLIYSGDEVITIRYPMSVVYPESSAAPVVIFRKFLMLSDLEMFDIPREDVMILTPANDESVNPYSRAVNMYYTRRVVSDDTEKTMIATKFLNAIDESKMVKQ